MVQMVSGIRIKCPQSLFELRGGFPSLLRWEGPSSSETLVGSLTGLLLTVLEIVPFKHRSSGCGAGAELLSLAHSRAQPQAQLPAQSAARTHPPLPIRSCCPPWARQCLHPCLSGRSLLLEAVEGGATAPALGLDLGPLASSACLVSAPGSATSSRPRLTTRAQRWVCSTLKQNQGSARWRGWVPGRTASQHRRSSASCRGSSCSDPLHQVAEQESHRCPRQLAQGPYLSIRTSSWAPRDRQRSCHREEGSLVAEAPGKLQERQGPAWPDSRCVRQAHGSAQWVAP